MEMKNTAIIVSLIFVSALTAGAANMSAGGGYYLVSNSTQEMGGAVIGFFQYDFQSWLGVRGDLGYYSGGAYQKIETGASEDIDETNVTSLPYFGAHALALVPLGEGGDLYFGPGISYSSNSGELKTTQSLGGISTTTSQDFSGSNLGISMLLGGRASINPSLYVFGDVLFWNAYQASYELEDSNFTVSQNVNTIAFGIGIGTSF
jgi:hypothetical protein